MKQAPLQLEQLFLGKVSVTPSRVPLTAPGELRVDTMPAFQRDNADPSVWTVQLLISFKAAGNQSIAYEGEIEMLGRFRVVAKELEEEKHRELVAVNTLSILYSSARESIAMLTGHGPFGKLLLPSVSFADQRIFAPGEQPPPEIQPSAPKTSKGPETKIRATTRSHAKTDK
jgi:preprotein translocase subunit SecB